MTYEFSWQCADCDKRNKQQLTKFEASFEYCDPETWNISRTFSLAPCSRCGSKSLTTHISFQPAIDKELLDFWGNKPNLSFIPSGDEIAMLANTDYLPFFLEAIDEDKYLKRKINMLVFAVCVMLYDAMIPGGYLNLTGVDERKKMIWVNKLKPELIKRKDKVRDAEYLLFDYVKTAIYPEIGMV